MEINSQKSPVSHNADLDLPSSTHGQHPWNVISKALVLRANTSLLLFCLCEMNVFERPHAHRHVTRVPTVSSLSIVRTCVALSSPTSQQWLQKQNIYFFVRGFHVSQSPTALRNVMCLSSHVVISGVTGWLRRSREELSSVLSLLSLVPVCRYLKAAFPLLFECSNRCERQQGLWWKWLRGRK